MTAFTGWFAIAPLLPYIAKDLKLTPDQRQTSNIPNISSTVIFRILAGILCDFIGPRRVMATILIAGAIPTALTGLCSDVNGFYAVRFFIGILGATFVPCQFYTTQMYDKNVVGSANAFAGGWGNLGGGLTYILMPLVFDGLNSSIQNPNITWRVALVIPAGLCIIVAILNLIFADDYPGGDWLKRKDSSIGVNGHTVNGHVEDKVAEVHEANEKKVDNYPVDEDTKTKKNNKLKELWKAFINPNVIIMMMQYACTFGVELAVDGVIGEFFISHFQINVSSGNFIGAIFGLMNIFSRATGGMLSDFGNRGFGTGTKEDKFYNGMRGRLLCQFLALFLEGVLLLAFRFSLNTLASAIVVMIFFSYFTQAGCGTTYGIAPYIDPEIYGTVAGLIGTGGTLGGIAFASVFKLYAESLQNGFM
ncbi:11555_t:CDS:2, partial [Cetraspora pellucida]